MSNNRDQPTNKQDNPTNVVAYPDYGELAKQQGNTTIIEHFLAFLFTNNKKLTVKSLMVLFRNLAIILFIKTILDDSKTYLDKFKFTNIDYLKYQYQFFKYSENKYEITLSSTNQKWSHNNMNICINSLTPYLESKSIYISQPGTYYYSFQSFLVKVVTTNNKITFHVPDVVALTRHINDILDRHKEILLGNKTNMLKATVMPVSDAIQFNSTGLTYSYETPNYKKLYESLEGNFMINSMLNMGRTPYCVNFNGPPGTGKTTFGSYIANKALFDRIILYNLVQSSKVDFTTILTGLENKINNQKNDKKPNGELETILLIFDEVDKWLDSHINYKIDTFRNEARKKTETVGSNNEKTTESFTKLTEEEENDKRRQIHCDFLDKLYTLCDGQCLKDDKRYVIIFNTNDFDSLFENMGAKYDATRDRFQQYTFVKSNKQDIINITNGIRTTLKTEIEKTDKKILMSVMSNIIDFDESAYDVIPEDIEITCRSLFKILTDNSFNMPKSFECIKKYQLEGKKDEGNKVVEIFNDI